MPKELHLPRDAKIIRVASSEVAMHLGVADAIMYGAPAGPDGVQLYDKEVRGKQLSFPILRSESGWDQQDIQVANDIPGLGNDRKRLSERWTAYVNYGTKSDPCYEEIDFDCIPRIGAGKNMQLLHSFCEGVLALDYDSGFSNIKFEQRYGMYL